MEGFEILVSGEFARWMKSEGFLQEFLLSPKGEAQLKLQKSNLIKKKKQ